MPGTGYLPSHGSPAVRVLQRRLVAAGFSPGPIDGRYGPLTTQAVIRFQAAHGLQADGIAGPRTDAALASATVILQPGAGYLPGGSVAVRVLQRGLAAVGYFPGARDGRYGPRTQHAVRRFQRAQHLPADGIAGPRTLGHLRATLARHRSHPTHHLASWPRTRGSRRHPKPAPYRPAPVRVRQPRPSGLRQAPGAGSILWIVVLACLLVVGLAGALARRRRGPRRKRPVTATLAPHRVTASAAGQAEADHQEPHDGGGGLTPTAARWWEQALRHAEARGDPAAAFQLGLLFVLKRYRAATHHVLRRGPGEHPPSATTAGGGEALLVHDEDRAKAEAAFGRADQHGHAAAACNLGVLLEHRGDLTGALQAYQRADARGDAIGAYNLAALLEQQGDRDGAKAAYRRADQRGDAMSAYNLAVLLHADGDLPGAHAAYQRADQRGHPSPTHNPHPHPDQPDKTAAASQPDHPARTPDRQGSPTR